MPSRKYPQQNVGVGLRKTLIKHIVNACPHSMSHRDFFRDMIEMWAIAISNQLARCHDKYDDREQRYLQLAGKYNRQQLDDMAAGLALFQLIAEEEGGDPMSDVYQGLNLANEWKGQFFTPEALCQLIAAMTIDREAIADAKAKGVPYKMHDPAVGAGGMLVATIDYMDNEDIDFRDHVEFWGTDVDLTCVHMTFLQLASRGIIGVVFHGNSLSMEMHDVWVTPAYVRKYGVKVQPQPAELPAAS